MLRRDGKMGGRSWSGSTDVCYDMSRRSLEGKSTKLVAGTIWEAVRETCLQHDSGARRGRKTGSAMQQLGVVVPLA